MECGKASGSKALHRYFVEGNFGFYKKCIPPAWIQGRKAPRIGHAFSVLRTKEDASERNHDLGPNELIIT